MSEEATILKYENKVREGRKFGVRDVSEFCTSSHFSLDRVEVQIAAEEELANAKAGHLHPLPRCSPVFQTKLPFSHVLAHRAPSS